MSKIAQRTHPELWEKIKTKITKGHEGGEAGQWSARKAQLAVQEYKKRGGAYLDRKNVSDSLKRWPDGAHGKAGSQKRGGGENAHSSRRKAGASAARARSEKWEPVFGKIERKSKKIERDGGVSLKSSRSTPNREELLYQARYLDIEGRSNMLKAELQEAIRLAKH